MKSYIRLQKVENNRENEWSCTLDGNEITYEWGTVYGKKQKLVQLVKEGKNIGRANETTPEQQAMVEAKGKLNKKLDGAYVVVERTGLFAEEEINETRQVPKPMLAYDFQDCLNHLKQDMKIDIQPKLDGIRCLGNLNTGELYSRQGKLIVGCPHIEKQLLELRKEFDKSVEWVDGELYNHEISFQEIVSLVRKSVNLEIKEAEEKIQYHIYDCISPEFFPKRNNMIMDAIDSCEPKLQSIFAVETIGTRYNSENVMKAFERIVTQKNYEGLIFRKLDVGYENKRTHSLIKYKEFYQEEFEIIGVEKEEFKNTLGAFVVEMTSGQQFKARPAVTQEVKDYLWDIQDTLIGHMCTIKFQELSNDGIPRFPVFIGIRDLDDMG